MTSTITEKMKDSVLRVMLEIYKESNSALPPKDFDFLLTNTEFKQRLPMLEKGAGSFLVDTVKHLEGENLVRQDELRFYFTQRGLERAKALNSAPAPSSDHGKSSWQDNIFLYIAVGIAIVVAGGLILGAVQN